MKGERRPPRAVKRTVESDDESADYAFEPVIDAYLARPDAGRRKLTPRDMERNRGVQTLFQRITPGLPIDADPSETRHEPESFDVALRSALRGLRLEVDPWLDDLERAWPELVEPHVARDARPGKFVDGVLYLFVASSLRLSELRRNDLRKIEQAVRSFKGGRRVRQVRLVVDSV